MTTSLPVLRRALRESWRSLLAWTIGFAAVLLLYLPLYPSIGGNGQMQQIINSLPPELVHTLGYDQIGSGPGYTQSTFYGLMGFFLITAVAVTWGASSIAGAEESGRLELDLAHGIGRITNTVEMAVALLVRLLWLGFFAGIVVSVLNGPSELGLSASGIAAATGVFVGLGMFSGSFALLCGAATGRKAFAIAGGAGIAVVGYAFNAIANQTASADWLRVFSPYAWAYHQPPLVGSLSVAGLLALWGSSVLFVAAGAWVLNRRDITG